MWLTEGVPTISIKIALITGLASGFAWAVGSLFGTIAHDLFIARLLRKQIKPYILKLIKEAKEK